MKNVTKEQFEQFRTRATWFPLSMNFPTVQEKVEFYGAEIGDGVTIVQFWNTDFCTASFHIKDVEIVKYGDKYTIAPVGVEGVIEPVLEQRSIEPIEESSEADLMNARLAAIAAADADDTFRINTPVETIKNDEPTSILDEVKKEANRESILDEPKPVAAPIVKKGREKQHDQQPKQMPKVVPIEKPTTFMPSSTFVRKEQPQRPTQAERRVTRPTPPPAKPDIDFGDW